MTIFIVGPTAGYFDNNREAFDEASGSLRGQGTAVVTQLDVSEAFGTPRAAFAALLDADTIALLPGWESDLTARLMGLLAWKLEIPLFVYPEMTPPAEAAIPAL